DTNIDPSLVPSSKKTTIQYFDTGWIYTSQDPGMPRFHFDYTAEGQQIFRAPEDANGNLDLSHQMLWTYLADSDLQSRSDTQGQSTTFTYDAGKKKHFDYDQANWLQDAIDYSTNPTEQITESFFPTGWEKQRVTAASNGAGGWNTKQTTNWDYFANGKLDHMSTVNGAGTTLE